MAAGVVKELDASNRSYYTVEDIMQLMGVKEAKAYRMMQTMQKELKAKGKLFSGYPQGRIPKKAFDELCMIK